MSGGKSPGDHELVAYLDDELDAERVEEVEAMLARDPAAAARVESWRRNDELLRAALNRTLAEPLPPTLHVSHRGAEPAGDEAPIRAPIRQVQRLQRIRREQREKLVALTVASFAAGSLATMAAAGFTELAPQMLAAPAELVFPGLAWRAEGDRLARRAMEAFRTFGSDDVHPVEATSRAEIASWLGRRVGAPVHAPDLKAVGLRLLGGRLTPADHGAAALLLYATPSGNRIGLFIGRSSARSAAPHYAQDHITGAVWWMQRGASYAVVGRNDRKGLLRIARLVLAQGPGRGASTAAEAPAPR